MLIDTHAHIYLDDFEEDRQLVLQQAEKEHITKILLPAIDSSTHTGMLDLENREGERCVSMMGLHPCSVKGEFKEELKIALDYLEKRSFVAVGEIGLDFYWDRTFLEQQNAAFHEQIEWALQYDIPIVIHSREAVDECIQVVKEHQKGKLRGVFHCFSGNRQQAEAIIELGFYLGIGGVVTFKNAGLDKVMQTLDLDRIVLETDSPYLSPVPFRGKRNEPAYLRYVVEKMSVLKQLPVDEISRITTTNAMELFRLDK